MGRPRHVRNSIIAERIKAMALVGVPHHFMPLGAGISIKTILREYREELDYGKFTMIARNLRSLQQAADRGEPWAICFSLKIFAGMRESNKTVDDPATVDEHGNPIDPEAQAKLAAVSTMIRRTTNPHEAAQLYSQLVMLEPPKDDDDA